MSCDCTPFVYVANSGVSNIPRNGTIPLGSVVREKTTCCGDGVRLDGDSLICKGHGRAFLVLGNVSVSQVDTSGSTDPVLSVALLQNGSVVPGSETYASSPGTVTLPISAVVRNAVASSSVLTLSNTGPAVDLLGCALTVIPV